MALKWKLIFIVSIILIMLYLFIFQTLNPIFFSLAEIKAVRLANQVINQAVDEEVAIMDSDDLVTYQYNQQGDLILVQPNIKYINSFTSRISLRIQDKLLEISRLEVAIPLASILGVELLAGLGPDLKAKIVPVGFTRPPRIRDSFSSAGINQTRHKIYLEVIVQLKLIVPFQSKLVEVQADVPVTEVTILGRVPRVYIGLEGQEIQEIGSGEN